jgi:allantoate deiminase
VTSAERAQRVLDRADVLGGVSEETDRLVRRFATPALGEAAELIAGWMGEAGLSVRRDPVGNVIGRAGTDGPPLVLGSHFDTVRDAGRYDGVLGVLCAIEIADAIGSSSGPLEVVAFADEEGTRYGVAYLGSSAYRGRFDPAWLALADEDDVTMATAIESAGGDVGALRDPAASKPIAGYLEVHIEQGPVLETEGLPVGVVTTIVGQARGRVTFSGRAGHAGTVPPELRADALAGAAELVLAAESSMHTTDGLVATVGQLTVSPGAGNVIPGRVELSLDVRHADDGVREAAVRELFTAADAIAARRGLRVEVVTLQTTAAVPMDAGLASSLASAIESQGTSVRTLVSGAGHDAAVVGRDAPAAMLFVRCAGGVSHSPDESVAVADVAVTLDVLDRAARTWP